MAGGAAHRQPQQLAAEGNYAACSIPAAHSRRGVRVVAELLVDPRAALQAAGQPGRLRAQLAKTTGVPGEEHYSGGRDDAKSEPEHSSSPTLHDNYNCTTPCAYQ